MFSKAVKGKKKEIKKEMKAVEDSKSQEQKDFEKMQSENLAAAETIYLETHEKLNAIGYGLLPFLTGVPGNPAAAQASVTLGRVSWEGHKAKQLEKEAREAAELKAKEEAGKANQSPKAEGEYEKQPDQESV